MWSNDIKCKYMFVFPLKNLARKGLSLYLKQSQRISQTSVIAETDNLHPKHYFGLVRQVIVTWHSSKRRANDNCTNELHSPKMSRHVVHTSDDAMLILGRKSASQNSRWPLIYICIYICDTDLDAWTGYILNMSIWLHSSTLWLHIDGLVQERWNSSALTHWYVFFLCTNKQKK